MGDVDRADIYSRHHPPGPLHATALHSCTPPARASFLPVRVNVMRDSCVREAAARVRSHYATAV
jgi:hypothetical protein